MAGISSRVSGSLAGQTKEPKEHFILTGFEQNAGMRVFSFQDGGRESSGIRYTVSAHLELARHYGIPTQELPLLCRSILEQRQSQAEVDFCFSEDQMSRHCNDRVLVRRAALLKKKSRLKTPTVTTRIGWRATQVQPV